jgi:hypothetical protein
LSKSSQKAVNKLSKVVKKLSQSCQKVFKVVKKFDPTFVPPEPSRGKNWQKKALFAKKLG